MVLVRRTDTSDSSPAVHSLFAAPDCCVVGAKADRGQLDAAATKAVEELIQHIERHARVVTCTQAAHTIIWLLSLKGKG